MKQADFYASRLILSLFYLIFASVYKTRSLAYLSTFVDK